MSGKAHKNLETRSIYDLKIDLNESCHYDSKRRPHARNQLRNLILSAVFCLQDVNMSREIFFSPFDNF